MVAVELADPRWLELDHVGTEITEPGTGERAGQHLRRVDDPQPGQWRLVHVPSNKYDYPIT